ncbi:MAG: Putative dTDP-4-dehydrorhamnose reductase [Microgenomates bacterium 39_7]|nr:MAG: Putative dTDP-4-dehydrorhamnose reductase [Microgenomates bacterium 39_7]
MASTLNIYQPNSDLQLSDHFFKTKIDGLLYFMAPKKNDERGFFSEIVKLPELEEVIGKPFEIKQVNCARSQQNVIRGLHAENWNKLVVVTSGLAFSAIADIRPDSSTFKQVELFELGCDHQQEYGSGLFITQGLANSVCVLEGPLNYLYFVDKLYSERDKTDDQAISLFDEELAIQWPIPRNEMILSQRDLNAVSLKEAIK